MQTIEGTKIRIDSATLKQHFQLRAARHTEKANEAFADAKKLREVLGIRQTPRKKDLSKYSSSYRRDDDPAQNALEEAWNSDKRAAKFTALAKYIIPEVTYELTNQEVDELELVAQFRRQLDLE